MTPWVLFFMLLPDVRCFRVELTEHGDALFSSRDVTSSVMRDSWLPGSTLVYVTDGTASYQFFSQAIKDVNFDYNVGTFEVPSNDRIDRSSSWSLAVIGNINKIRKSSSYTMLLLTSDDDEFLIQFMEEALVEDLLIWPTRLLLVTRLSLPRLHPLRKSLSGINAMVITPEETSKSARWGVYTYLPYSHRVAPVAYWTSHSGLSYLANAQLFPNKFRRLTDGAHLDVVGQNFPPHVVVRKSSIKDGSEESSFVFTGPLLLVLEMLADNINFTYNLVRPSDGSWGFLFPNGTWNGMVGMLHRKEVDFGLGPFGITYLRAQVVDYTSPLVIDYGRILGRRGNTAVDPWSFALPLTYPVWISIFVTLFLILFFAKVMSKFHWDSGYQSPRIHLAMYLRAFLQQDIKVPSHSSWERAILGVWMLSILILIECYSTNLISLLAVRYISEPYQTVRAMIDDPSVTMIWFANTAHQQYLAGVESGIFYDLVQAGKRGRMKLITPAEYEETVNTYVSQGDHVMMNPETIMKVFLTEDYMDEGNCKFYLSREGFLPLTFCMVVQKYSPLLGPINEVIRAVIEGGFYNYWMDNAFANAKSCKKPPTKITVKEPLSLANVWGMFVVLLSGYLIGFCVLCLEIMSKSTSERHLEMRYIFS
ncbi:glutamate receptor 1-like [Palaemon carinicauda]|uniref:glutamate receptor 1-like n=1 Tax=Palaemon carinicauda TaxID=392227 RepID=UPI0035B59E3A